MQDSQEVISPEGRIPRCLGCRELDLRVVAEAGRRVK
jgi:hypothetical protein